jgi:hypothetical protein
MRRYLLTLWGIFLSKRSIRSEFNIDTRNSFEASCLGLLVLYPSGKGSKKVFQAPLCDIADQLAAVSGLLAPTRYPGRV